MKLGDFALLEGGLDVRMESHRRFQAYLITSRDGERKSRPSLLLVNYLRPTRVDVQL